MVNSTLDAVIIRNDTCSYKTYYHKNEATPGLFVVTGQETLDGQLAEGYRAMSPTHKKYADITFKAISEVVPD